jgi:hypothetical protein
VQRPATRIGATQEAAAPTEGGRTMVAGGDAREGGGTVTVGGGAQEAGVRRQRSSMAQRNQSASARAVE